MSRLRCLLLAVPCLLLIGDGANSAGGRRTPAVAQQPASALALIDSIRQAGRPQKAAASLEFLGAAEKLLPASDVTAVDSRKRTALHWCVLSAQSASGTALLEAYGRLVEDLLVAGADINAEDAYGNTPLDYQRRGAQPLEDVLMEQGAQRGYTQSAQARVLHLLDQVRQAEREGDAQRVHALLESNLPANSLLSIRLLTRLSSHESRPGDPIETVVIAPVEAGGRVVVVAAGARVEGTVLHARRASTKFEQAQLEIDICTLINPGTGGVPIAALLVDVDNARERVQDGRIIGIPFPHTFSERMSWGSHMVGMVNPLLAKALDTATLGWQKRFNREIILEPGTDMTARVMAPESLHEVSGATLRTVQIPPGLAGIIGRLPARTTTTHNVPSDLVNVLFVGGPSHVAAAFEEAGWRSAQNLGVTSGLRTFASLAQQSGYPEAPVSTLLLNGRKPDLVYQKQTNTFSKRHHIRIWRYEAPYEGRELWLGAATRDVGIAVAKAGRSWIHRIDPQVDREQVKVRDDLQFTGRVDWISLVDRPDVPRRTTNGTGDTIRTEGRLLVLSLGSEPVR